MTHITLPVLLEALRAQAKSQDPPAMGTLTVVCHLICCVPATLLGTSNFKQIIPTLIAGLVYFSKNLNAFTQSDEITPIPSRLLPVVLAALLKILTTAPEEVSIYIIQDIVTPFSSISSHTLQSGDKVRRYYRPKPIDIVLPN